MVAVPGESMVSTKVENGKVPKFKEATLAKQSSRKIKRPISVSKVKRKISPKYGSKRNLDEFLEETSTGRAVTDSTAAVDGEEQILGLDEIVRERQTAKHLLLEDFARCAAYDIILFPTNSIG